MSFLLDDFKDAEASRFGTSWLLFSDQAFDGDSSGKLDYAQDPQEGPVLRLQGEIRPGERNAFVQMALPLVASRYLFDARHFRGVSLRCRSDAADGFFVLLRTKELSMPWQHYRAPFSPTAEWSSLQIPFEAFSPFHTAHELNLERLSRLALMAGPPNQKPDLWISEVGFYE